MSDKDELVDYFIEQTNDRFGKIEEKLDELLKFKWQIIGGSVTLSLVATLVIQGILYMIQK